MSEEEILNKYTDLIDKGYCSDCNELNCIDNFPHTKIAHAIRELQQENKILKENAENNDKVVDKVNWENQLLKKENQQLKDNWNMLKEFLTNRYNNGTESISYRQVFMEIRRAMQALEIAQELGNGDSNE